MDKSESKKIGLLGGTFDPIHYGHLLIAEKAREEFGLSYILFIPSGIPPHKKKVYASALHRKNMVEIAISDNPYFKLCDIEIKKNKICYTYETVKELKKENPSAQFYLIVGEDSFYDFPNWYKSKELLEEIEVLVAPRSENLEISPDFKVSFKIIHCPFLNISSTYIRNCIFEKKSVKYLLPDSVIEYIKKEGLYERKNFE